MKVKISKSPILIFVCVIMALEMRFANIFQLPYLRVYANMTLVAIIITTLLFLNTIVNNYIYNTLKPYRSQINIIVLVMTLAIVVITIYSYNKYGQTLFNYFSCFRVQLYFMLTASIIFIFTKQEGYDYFLKILVVMTIIYVVLCFINSFSYTFRGRLIWETLSFGFRKDRLRCQAPFSFVIVVPYVFSKIFTEKLKKEINDRQAFLKKLAVEYVMMGKECEKEKMYDAAINNYEKALQLCPDYPEAKRRIKKIKG